MDVKEIQKIGEEEIDSLINEKGKSVENIEKEEEIKEKLKECYRNIVDILKEYVELREDYYPIIALWILGTYMHNEFEAYPYLFINAMRGSGKTRLLRLISTLSNGSKGRVQTGITESVLFRTQKHIALVLDECEQIAGKDKGTLREYLNASYKKGGIVARAKKVKKDGKEDYEIEEFEPYRPIAMANIWGMEEVLEDRCLTLILEKSSNKAITMMVENFKEDFKIKTTLTTLTSLNDINQCRLCRVVTSKNIYISWNTFIKQHYDINNPNNINNTNNTNNIINNKFFKSIISTGIDGRNLELTLPFFIISNYIDEELFEQIVPTIKKIIEEKRSEEFSESIDVSFIDFVAQYPNGDYYISIQKVTSDFKSFTQSNDDWINTKWVGRALKRLNLIRNKRRMTHGREVILDVIKAQEKIKIFK